jgi:hypothetical protein
MYPTWRYPSASQFENTRAANPWALAIWIAAAYATHQRVPAPGVSQALKSRSISDANFVTSSR